MSQKTEYHATHGEMSTGPVGWLSDLASKYHTAKMYLGRDAGDVSGLVRVFKNGIEIGKGKTIEEAVKNAMLAKI